jgi:hypothetical protein
MAAMVPKAAGIEVRNSIVGSSGAHRCDDHHRFLRHRRGAIIRHPETAQRRPLGKSFAKRTDCSRQNRRCLFSGGSVADRPEGLMLNRKSERWMAAAGFIALAAMLCVEGTAILGTYDTGPGHRQPSTLMMTVQFRSQ